MRKITSIADLFFLAKTDLRYQKLAILAYKDCGYLELTYDNARQWIEGWASGNVVSNFPSCKNMVELLNKRIKLIPNYESTTPELIAE